MVRFPGGRGAGSLFGRGGSVVVWLASSRASLAPIGDVGWPKNYQAPDATKPAFGGLCQLGLVGRGRLNMMDKILI